MIKDPITPMVMSRKVKPTLQAKAAENCFGGFEALEKVQASHR
ncbi:hypothetical protein ACFL0D_09395 [Thermoproteota archaeon]